MTLESSLFRQDSMHPNMALQSVCFLPENPYDGTETCDVENVAKSQDFEEDEVD